MKRNFDVLACNLNINLTDSHLVMLHADMNDVCTNEYVRFEYDGNAFVEITDNFTNTHLNTLLKSIELTVEHHTVIYPRKHEQSEKDITAVIYGRYNTERYYTHILADHTVKQKLSRILCCMSHAISIALRMILDEECTNFITDFRATHGPSMKGEIFHIPVVLHHVEHGHGEHHHR